ncbi:MAG TPA: M20 family metallopeptidase [Candidatus Sumerlaeota bacterium]|nr:M20 family metallopeptidase [Candidatus Sumerlaeota bacterium]
MNSDSIRTMAGKIHPWLVELRRDFHRHPELGRGEFRTREKIIACLDEMGIPSRKIAGTGVVGFIEGKGPGKVVGLRADMDALPMQEKNDVPYKSQNDGVMHACGHDAHTTILLGAARILNDLKGEFSGGVKLFFQPDEEGRGGADIMVREGCVDDPVVNYVLGLHVMSYLETGQIEIRYGKLNASADAVTIIVRGRSAHGAYPEKGVDAIVAAAHVVTALQTLVSRNISPLNSAVLSFGKISGGEAGNALAEEVTLTGTLRAIDGETRRFCKTRIEEIAVKTAEALGATAEVRIRCGYEPLINHDEIVKVVEETASEMLGAQNIIHKEFPSLGVEDFSYFLEKAKGAFFHIGCGNKAKNIVAPNHNSSFDIDEDCLPIGVQLQVACTLKLLAGR